MSQIPPHDTAAEESVLGAVLLESESLIKIGDILTADDFFLKSNSLLYATIEEMYNNHRPIDVITVSNALRNAGVLDDIGGSARLTELIGAVHSAAHVFEYSQIVKHKSTLRNMIKAGDAIARLGQDTESPVESLLEKAEKSVFSISQTFLKNRFISIKEVLTQRYEVFAERHSNPEEISTGIPTGYPSLDRLLGGLQPSDMVVLAARPSMGKTAFSLAMGLNMALRENKSIAVFSLEMSKEQLVDRLFASAMGVDSWKLQKGKLSDEEFMRMGEVMDRLTSAQIYIDDSAGSSMGELRAKARRLQMEHGVDVIIVDYLQLITTGNNAFAGNRVQEISEISRSFKQLARELHVPVLALSQLSRAVEQRPNKQPVLSDLRESGAIEQDADVVMMLYREEYYDEETDRKDMTDIFVRKHRNGPIGHIELKFDRSKMQFYELDSRYGEPMKN